jgi:SAM-dependent methyltransferase
MSLDAQARRQFLSEYQQIRHAEGRGSDDPAYYRALPYTDLSARNTAMWAMRGKTYRYFERRILPPIERTAQRPLDILDLGAGNAWMSYRLSLRNHRPVAVDIFSDAKDGLGAARNYPHQIECVEAEFDRLPFGPESFDLAIFNSSLHYSTDYIRTLSETCRCLRPSGTLVILDSPIYSRRDYGEAMVAERHADFEKRYGFRSDALPSIEFLDTATLKALADRLRLRWRIYKPWYGWQWHLRPWKARLYHRRPPSRFWILTARVSAA